MLTPSLMHLQRLGWFLPWPAPWRPWESRPPLQGLGSPQKTVMMNLEAKGGSKNSQYHGSYYDQQHQILEISGCPAHIHQL